MIDIPPTHTTQHTQPTASQSFTVRAVNDGLPEQFEAFSVSLFRTEGGGRIVDPREARIAIQSSNDPSGVVGFTAYPQGIIANEGAEIRVGVFRSSGTQGTVTLTWSMSPPDNTVFLITTDTVVFTDGQSEATFAIRVSIVLVLQELKQIHVPPHNSDYYSATSHIISLYPALALIYRPSLTSNSVSCPIRHVLP